MSSRITRSYRQTIDASPDTVFPLLCPVREAEWLEGWRYTMVFSRSGLAEEGAVFTTPGKDGEEDTVWIVTRHDAVARVVEFTRFTPGSRVCVLRIAVTGERDRSFVDITYQYTALSEAGLAFIEGFTEESFQRAVTFWEDSMNHWLATGERLAAVG